MGGDDRLSEVAKSIIEQESEALCLSLVTFWELTIKEAKGRVAWQTGIAGLYTEWVEIQEIPCLTLSWPHLLNLGRLPHLHRDPFDRLLVAQALCENLTLVTADPNIPRYPGVRVRW